MNLSGLKLEIEGLLRALPAFESHCVRQMKLRLRGFDSTARRAAPPYSSTRFGTAATGPRARPTDRLQSGTSGQKGSAPRTDDPHLAEESISRSKTPLESDSSQLRAQNRRTLEAFMRRPLDLLKSLWDRSFRVQAAGRILRGYLRRFGSRKGQR